MSNFYVTSITAAIWTIIQTIFHLMWTVYGYCAYSCKTVPSHYILVFIYLTYFYREKCGDILLEGEEFYVMRSDLNSSSVSTTLTKEYSLYDVIKETLEKAELPEESNPAFRTYTYIVIFIICDFIWITASVLLLVGTLIEAKKICAILFFGPWLLTTGIMILVDVIAAVNFGLDIRHIYSFSSWLHFIGVKNYNDFIYLNDEDGSPLTPLWPSIVLVCLSSRLFIFWIPNVYTFYSVLSSSVLAYQNGKLKNSNVNPGMDSSFQNSSGNLNLNTSEARIRKWQLFYGATDTISSQNQLRNTSSRSQEPWTYGNMTSEHPRGSYSNRDVRIESTAF